MDSRTCTAILVVEDEDKLRQVVVGVLESEGFQVYQAENGSEAIQVLQVMPRPALLLADLMTAEIDVPALIGALRADDRFVTLPVVAVTEADTAVPGGYSRVKKPIDLDDLLRIATGLCFRRI